MQTLLTALELSKVLKIPTPAIYELAARGELPSIRIGRRVRFDPDAVAQWLTNPTTKANAVPAEDGNSREVGDNGTDTRRT